MDQKRLPMKVVKSFGLQGKKAIIQLLIILGLNRALPSRKCSTKVPDKNISFPEKDQEISFDSLL